MILPVNTKLLLPFSLVFLFSSVNSAGELYKWTDKNGVVHYSENKPENSNAVEALNLNQTSAFEEVATAIAPKRSVETSTRQIVLLRPDIFWELPPIVSGSKRNTNTTTYYFGGDCVSPSTASFKQMLENHRALLPSVNTVIDNIVTPIDQLNYPVNSSLKKPLQSNLARYDRAVVLNVKLDDLKYDLCVTELNRTYLKRKKTQHGFEAFDYHEGEYTRRRAIITLDWKLMDGLSGEPLYSGKTSGSANYWDRNIYQYNLKTIETALKNATHNLFANADFTKLLIAMPTNETNSRPLKADTITKSAKTDEGLFGNISSLFQSNAVNKSEFAKVFSSLNPIKIMLLEHYLSEGAWPQQLADIGLSHQDVYQEGYVRDIELDYDGTIIVKLNAERFEENAVILLTPKESLGGMQFDWLCRSNLDDSYYQNICTQL